MQESRSQLAENFAIASQSSLMKSKKKLAQSTDFDYSQDLVLFNIQESERRGSALRD